MQRINGLVKDLAALLHVREETLALAESCTGGWVGKAITELPGSSGWFSCGFVTYSNEAKSRLLGVREETIRSHGAISGETALEMAAGALRHGRTDWSLAVTGIAGPTGGSPDKPVGLVWFAWAGANGVRDSESCVFAGDRRSVRIQSVEHVLQGLLERVM